MAPFVRSALALATSVLLTLSCSLPGTHAARALFQANGTLGSPAPVPSDVRGYLLVTDGVEGGKITVVDLRTGQVNETLQLANASTSVYSSSTGRFAYILQRTANLTSVYDSQLYLDFHEDHWHLEQDAAPGLMDFTIPGAAPTHFTQRGRYAALFHDQSGVVSLVNEVFLSQVNELYSPRSITVDRQHGAAVPLRGNFYAVSYANQTALAAGVSSLPVGVQVFSEMGEVVYDGAMTECPGLHGSATNGYHALFGCRDGILVVTYTAPATLTHSKIPYPVPDVYTGSLYGHFMYKTFFGRTTAGEQTVGIHMFDPIALSATLVINSSADGDVVSVAYDPAGAFFAVLTDGASGTLTLLDPKTGAVLRRATGVLAAPAQAAEGDSHDAITPEVKVGLGRIYISNPEAGSVNEHHQDTFELLRTFNVGGHPFHMAVLGPIQYWDYLYQH